MSVDFCLGWLVGMGTAIFIFSLVKLGRRTPPQQEKP